MDTERALSKVDELLDLVDKSKELEDNGGYTARSRIDQQIYERLPLVESIADSFEPSLASNMQPRSLIGEWQWSPTREGLTRLRGMLTSQQDEEEIFGTTGPRLVASHLHPTVWNAAAQLWDDGHRRSAIQAACTAIDEALQAKLQSWSSSGAPQIMQAFDPKAPSEHQARLRFDGFSADSETWKSAHEGAKFYGAGCMLRIRNLATHHNTEPPEDEALEQLAALSVLARWVENARVERSSGA